MPRVAFNFGLVRNNTFGRYRELLSGGNFYLGQRGNVFSPICLIVRCMSQKLVNILKFCGSRPFVKEHVFGVYPGMSL